MCDTYSLLFRGGKEPVEYDTASSIFKRSEMLISCIKYRDLMTKEEEV